MTLPDLQVAKELHSALQWGRDIFRHDGNRCQKQLQTLCILPVLVLDLLDSGKLDIVGLQYSESK